MVCLDTVTQAIRLREEDFVQWTMHINYFDWWGWKY